MPQHKPSANSIIPGLLLTGISGQVGSAWSRLLRPETYCAPMRSELDLDYPERIRAALDHWHPQIIINPAAYTAVDKAESDISTAQHINADSVAEMASWCRRNDALLVHYSTDYVFDGLSAQPYPESAPIHPLSVYGRTKSLGELAIRASDCRHIIIRTSWVAGVPGNNFVKTILKLTQNRSTLKVVNDQWGSPTSADLIAQLSHELVIAFQNQCLGSDTWHLTASGATNWHQFACHIVDQAQQQGIPLQLSSDHITPIPSSEYPVPAPRPRNSQLDLHKLMHTLGKSSLPSWQEGMQPIIEALCQKIITGESL